MNVSDALGHIDTLNAAASDDYRALSDSESRLLGWTEQCRVILVGALGSTHRLVKIWDYQSQVRQENYTVDGSYGRRTMAAWRSDALQRALQVLDAARFAIESVPTEGDAIGAATVDSELWEHVGGLVTDGA